MDYVRYQKIAKDQIRKYGQPVVFHLLREAEYDPVAGEARHDRIDEECHAVLASPESKAYAAGTAHLGDAVLLIDGGSLSQSPTENDTVTVAGEDWRVVAVSRVSPAETVIIFKVYIKRS